MVNEPAFTQVETAPPTRTFVGRDGWLDKPLLLALNWEKAIYLLFIVLAIGSRFYDIGARVMSHDESLHTYFSHNLAQGRGYQHTPLMHGPFLFHVTALSYFLFGADDTTSRLPFAIFGIVLVALPYFFRRWLGRFGAIAASFMLLISPSILYHARYIRQEESILVWTMLTVLCVWRYLEDRRAGWLVGLAAVLAFHAADKATSFLNVALFLIFLVPLALWQLYAGRGKRGDAGMLVAFGAVTAIFMLGLSIVFELAGSRLAQALNLGAVITQAAANGVNLSLNTGALVFVAILLVASAAVCAGLVYLYRVTFGEWMRQAVASSPAFSVVIVMVTTTLFMGSPAMLLIKNRIWQAFRGEELVPIKLLGEMGNLQNNTSVIATMMAMALALIAISVAIGLVWGARQWLPIIGVFLAITVTLFTTVFTNTAGIGTGFVGQLGYWMAQQSVQRGSQPPYYYALLVPLYEYTVLVGAVCAMSVLAIKLASAAVRRPTPLREGEGGVDQSAPASLSSPSPLHQTIRDNLFPLFLSWWAVATWIIYTLAGEKMPWLTVHFALPMALLTGWFLQRVAVQVWDGIRTLPRTRWLAIAGLSILVVALFVRMLSLIGGLDLGSGDRAAVLQWVFNFALGAAGLALAGYFLGRAANGASLPAIGLASFALLSVLTVRTAVNVTYINYDYTKEFLFYAHGAPGVKIALNQIEDLSKRLGGRTPLKVGYTQETSWPMSWYMALQPGARFLGAQLPPDFSDLQVIMASEQDAQFPQIQEQLAPDYTRFDYMLVWWPMQDYYDLNWERVSYSLFNPQARAALWEIAFNRNFEPYAKLFNKTSLTPENWSPGHRFSLFVRNDMADQLWDYRIGQAAGGRAPVTGPKLQSAAGIAVAPDGTRFVIDHKINRAFKQDADGNVIATFGGSGNQPGKFNDAWGVAVDSAGNLFVADTFNHRVQKFDANGTFLTAWGQPGATNAPGAGTGTQFFGPRDIAVDAQGRLLVTDTGNKRVQVFDADGNFIAQFGSDGSGTGQFNEPVGLAVDADGNVYVADTWNKRIQVFDTTFNFVREIPVTAWARMDVNTLQAVDHKPYLAIEGNTLFVTSPRTAQVLAFTLQGTPVPLPNVTFEAQDMPTGVEVVGGTLYVTNGRDGSVLSFPLSSGAR